MANWLWYWHRLRAMGAAELGAHVRKRCFQFVDARRERDWAMVPLMASEVFPRLPERAAAPAALRAALQRDTEAILSGRWLAFGQLELRVDDPPQWHTDYLAGKNLATTQPAFQLNHRALPDGADIRLIWELSRWHALARLAQAAYVLEDERAGRKCVRWLEDWVTHNPPFRGWNWTSALEAGVRLVQFAWIDALLAERAAAWGLEAELERLRYEILPPHVWFTWRYQSRGSSANNHRLGELAGLIVAGVRWPALAPWGVALERTHRLWEREVLAQFAEDGGNREQALNYQLFSWELCWQAWRALAAAGRAVSPAVEERLASAAKFFRDAQAEQEPWDYGDSDNGYVAPFFCEARHAVKEWRDWLGAAAASPGLQYWLGDPPPPGQSSSPAVAADAWTVYPVSGLAVCRPGDWFLRFDASPLGYLATAAHGHLDALHVSIWFQQVALVVDPGTGAYYADAPLRDYLASRAAHNGPSADRLVWPKRLGPFLWAEHHARPVLRSDAPGALTGEMAWPGGTLRRTLVRLEEDRGWRVEDVFEPNGGGASELTVRWQFAPGSSVKKLSERAFLVHRAAVAVKVEVDAAWTDVVLVEPGNRPLPPGVWEGVCSPGFRQAGFAPYLKLTGRASHKPCVLGTTFLACPPT